MNPENLKLTIVVSKIQYYEQLFEKYRDADSLRNAQMYREKAEAIIKEMEEGIKSRQNKLYINR